MGERPIFQILFVKSLRLFSSDDRKNGLARPPCSLRSYKSDSHLGPV